MPVAEATVQTGHASRYLARLCQHAGKMRSHFGQRPPTHSRGGAPPEIRSVEWSDNAGTLILSMGLCTLSATDSVLRIRAEASTSEDLARIQELISRRLENFGRRDRLTVRWQPARDLRAEPAVNGVHGAAADNEPH